MAKTKLTPRARRVVYIVAGVVALLYGVLGVMAPDVADDVQTQTEAALLYAEELAGRLMPLAALMASGFAVDHLSDDEPDDDRPGQ